MPELPGADGGEPAPTLTPRERLERWQQFGAVWRVVERSGATVTVALCRCDGGEEVERLRSDDVDLLSWLGSRMGSDQ